MLCLLATSSLALVPQLTRTHRSAATVPAAARRLAVSPQAALTTDERVVPREVLFGNPEYASPMLSPDGKLLAYLRPDENNVLNVWCRTIGQTDDRVVTADKSRGIRQAFWAEDSKTLLYMQDDAGDENFHLFAIDATSPSAVARDLTPYKGAKAQNVITNKRFPDQILVAINNREPTCFDMYRCSLATGELTLDTQNPGDILGWGTEDESFEVREAVSMNPADSSTVVRVRDSASAEWRELVVFPYGEEGNMVSFSQDAKSCLVLSTLGRETTALVRLDAQTGKLIEEIASNDKCNCGGVLLDDDTKEVRAVSFNYARTERSFFDAELEKDFKKLEAAGAKDSEVTISSRTRDDQTWVVMYRRDDGPSEYVLYDRTSGKSEPLFVSQPSLLEYEFAHMEDVRIPARDGLELVAYLTRAQTDKPTPMVLLVHGGPWARDFWGFNPAAQWLANRGYAVLQVNYRGSSGYGKSFLHKGDKGWGIGPMQHDLTDAVAWAVKEGIALEDKVCIYGGSYGGYACLAGMTFTPDLYACGVDIVGPSNIKTLLDSIPPYWGPLRNDMLLKIGDVDNDVEFNQAISPLFHVDKIKAPLLIGQGANDPRVKQAEADQIAFSMAAKQIPVEYVLYPDEGHGFARPPNRIDFNARTELFLAEHLGGRSEAFEAPEGATATFPLQTKAFEYEPARALY
jgi:dipeptidyl aminopeptidase/acylaminoacyl peptidase